MNSVERKIMETAIRMEIAIQNAVEKTRKKFLEKNGDGEISTLMKILISVILGIALLAALKTFIFDKFFPELETKLLDMLRGVDSSSGNTTT